MGQSLLEQAKKHPDKDFIGVEVHRPGVGSLLSALDAQEIENVRIYNVDANDVLAQCIPNDSLELIQIFFPDPWPKKKHHKRRLIQGHFVELLATKLKAGGKLHLATDWQDYAEHMMAVMSAQTQFSNSAGANEFSKRPEYRPKTKFEKRGEKLGHGVWDLIFCRVRQLGG